MEDSSIWYVTNVDTEVLALRTAIEALPPGFCEIRAAQPWILDGEIPLDHVACVVVRLLGGRGAWKVGLDGLVRRCMDLGIPFLGFGGEVEPDPEMTALSSVPSGTLAEAHRYLSFGGPQNFEQMLRFLSDTVLLTGFGFELPQEVPQHGLWRQSVERDPERPLIGVIFYRAHLVAGNTAFIDNLCNAIEDGGGDVLALWCYSLRDQAAAPVAEIFTKAGVDAVITTVLATGGMASGAGIVGGRGGRDGEVWDARVLTRLGVPILQSPSSGMSRHDWELSDMGLGPYDATSGVIVPELDGRIGAPVYAFNEVVDDGDELGIPVRAYRTVPDRVERVARLALRHASLRHKAAGTKRVALVMSAFPTKKSRLGNAVGLDTPASVIELLSALDREGYLISNPPGSGDELMAALADGLTYESEHLSSVELDLALGHYEVDRYLQWWSKLPKALTSDVETAWGPAPGTQRVHNGAFVISGIDLGNVVVAIQPPRGYGDDPVAIYHSPNLPPAHHYFAFYRWLDEVWGADALVHVGKHGTLEWLPGKSLALSSACAPDAALGDVPFFYPFVVNDPGEGAQAKRRSHAVIIDHLVPPITRADTYDDLARLEQLFDEYAQLQALDPTKLLEQRQRIWEVIQRASIHEDLGIEGDSVLEDAEGFGDLLSHVDGYLCELKDAQIRGGLHVLGRVLESDELISMILGITRLSQGQIPSLREQGAKTNNLDAENPRTLEAIELACRQLVVGAQSQGWRYVSKGSQTKEPESTLSRTMTWICNWLVPRLEETSLEITNLIRALRGEHIESGPSGSPSRGGAHVLPTGRNFYALDPKALPSELSWDVGCKLAHELTERHLKEEGTYPKTVGMVLWGTANMRTQGDDVAEVLALLGVRPVWEKESRRVVSLELIGRGELGRPRVDVTVRISGFFRDAFPGLIQLIDEAVELAAGAQDGSANPVFDHGVGDPRVFGPGPGAYGAGMLELLESRDWRSDDDLAAVYIAWSGHSYSRKGFGVADHEAMRRRYAAIDVAVKNQDNREHDIFDSDDYLQEHGGMVATIRSLTRKDPKAWFGDTKDPARPQIRSLGEEAARVVRTRVVNPKWIEAMKRHGYKGASEMAATVDYLFGYDATTHVVSDWMYEKVTESYVGDPSIREFFKESNPWALTSIAERLLEAHSRGLWNASPESLGILASGILESEGWEEERGT